MGIRKVVVLGVVLAMSAVAVANSWTISGHYLRLNGSEISGNSDNIGVMVSYDWLLDPQMTFAIEGIGSWDNPAELYGGGANMKWHLGCWEEPDLYVGGYGDYVHVRGLPMGGSNDGFIYGLLAGLKMPLNSSTALFGEYRYGWIDGGNLRNSIDEANWFIVGLEFKF